MIVYKYTMKQDGRHMSGLLSVQYIGWAALTMQMVFLITIIDYWIDKRFVLVSTVVSTVHPRPGSVFALAVGKAANILTGTWHLVIACMLDSRAGGGAVVLHTVSSAACLSCDSHVARDMQCHDAACVSSAVFMLIFFTVLVYVTWQKQGGVKWGVFCCTIAGYLAIVCAGTGLASGLKTLTIGSEFLFLVVIGTVDLLITVYHRHYFATEQSR